MTGRGYEMVTTDCWVRSEGMEEMEGLLAVVVGEGTCVVSLGGTGKYRVWPAPVLEQKGRGSRGGNWRSGILSCSAIWICEGCI